MTLKEMMSQRHVVKKYTDQDLSPEAQQEVSKRIDDLNQKFNLSMSLKVNDDNGLSSLAKHFMSKNATNYIILASKQKSDEADEALGYAAADLMLYVQSIGLNSWFIGGTYNHKLGQKEQLAVRSIVVIGHGQTNGGPHRSKSLSDVSDYQQKSYPEWYK
ncbi:MAG TPA: nitroreductase, partial [Lactobacillus sp.]|nr:nitroreductase [Lactobacillus sp.]